MAENGHGGREWLGIMENGQGQERAAGGEGK